MVLLLAPAPTWAQEAVRVNASLSPSTVRAGETAVLEITIETRGSAPEAMGTPSLPEELEVVGSREYSQVQFSLPGGRSRIHRREIVLAARTPGEYWIPPLGVVVDGIRYRTRPLSLSVSARPATAAAPDTGPEGEVMLAASLEPDTAFVGQQVTLESEVLISEDVRLRLRRTPDYQPPSPSGFWVQDLDPAPAVDLRYLGGQPYEVQRFRRAYFPLAPGRYRLAPVKIAYDVRRGFLNAPETHQVASDSLRLVVLPVPEAGKPPGFAGAVGSFEIQASLEPAEVPAGEAAVLSVEVAGAGNVKALPAPQLPRIPGVQVYSPGEEAEVRSSGGVVEGRKRFSWVLVPDRPGRIQLPEIEYPFFDPARRLYAVARAAAPPLRVRPAAIDVARGSRPAVLQVLKTEPAGESRLRWVRSPGFAALQLVPLAALVWAAWHRRTRHRPRPPSRNLLRRRCLEALAQARAESTGPVFLKAVADALRGWLAERFDDPSLRRSAGPNLSRALEAQGAAAGTAREIAELLDQLEHARYEPAPPTRDQRRELLAAAERLVTTLDRQVRRPRRRRAAAAPGALLPFLLAALPIASKAQAAAPPAASAAQAPAAQTSTAPFPNGVLHFLAGDYGSATGEFLEFVRRHPRDPHGWYNLGNAYYEAGQSGRAIWAWLRALRLQPRDQDARQNLAMAAAPASLLRRAVPTLPLSAPETLLLAALAWWLAAATLVAAALRPPRSTRATGAGIVLLLLALLGAWTGLRHTPDTALTLDSETPLRAAPSSREEVLRSLPAATPLTMLRRHAGWVQIRAGDGSQGWIERRRLGRI
ncbi:MAG: BatD family protein [Gemmatimonadetes bacterium]|nr:BatD family protein [Gemmatimonadota bacterium]